MRHLEHSRHTKEQGNRDGGQSMEKSWDGGHEITARPTETESNMPIDCKRFGIGIVVLV